MPTGGKISLRLDGETVYTATQYKNELIYLRGLCRTLHQPERGSVTINNSTWLPLQRRFEVNAQTFPGAPAAKAGNKLLTYGELDTQADELALHLQRRGLLPGSFCIVRLEPSFAEVRVILAILKAGGIYLQFDPGLRPQHEAAIFDVLEPPFLFVHEHEALSSRAGKLQVIRCGDEPMDLPYGWPDEARVGPRTPACAVASAAPGGGVCIWMRTHQSLAFPEHALAKTRRSTSFHSPGAYRDPLDFWQVLSQGALMIIPRASAER
jgi:hypothetical protein